MDNKVYGALKTDPINRDQIGWSGVDNTIAKGDDDLGGKGEWTLHG
jgi:hypothetical protein